ncbi:FKBP-type peptidyl-prolyl cis-trans isomerase [Winogradskyella immobilis]|uniref:Peptidyl-prolyl cis-trans isomerase n=1 Tax=Winogradskyella immobilis TaxID=2816852 RepID=A0ABS8EPL6_9FLAO|nr:FKBP-type peptidyl-prolyl cis-trans isomerase [Winogradskyella immobilis]MCC1485161.1 FKBP-type peptidyl-prolyl cis-trans isomerase [Winogradskyella immobilis]MCG0017253.1 FKBP-type peptidyl-prolyl cis-trans isomerase [Winogradskyella immobilis]
MKKILLLAILLATLVACNKKSRINSNVNLATNIDSVSYAIGANQAKGLLSQVPNLNIDAFMKGYLDVSDSTALKITEENCQIILQAYGQKLQQEQREKAQAESVKTKEDGVAFLEANKSKPGVITTESGLQYMVLKEGTGKQPQSPQANVTVHYTGTTTDGVQFETSTNGNPATFNLDGVIKGWTEGVQLMKEGAKYKFFIPEELAYGANPRPGGAIKPFMALIFEIELIKIN